MDISPVTAAQESESFILCAAMFGYYWIVGMVWTWREEACLKIQDSVAAIFTRSSLELF